METTNIPRSSSPKEGTRTLPLGDEVELNERATSRHDSVVSRKQLIPPTLKASAREVSPIRKQHQPHVPISPTKPVETHPNPFPILSNKTSPNLGSSILKTRSTPVRSTESFTDNPKVVGSTWVTRYHGKHWPVVLCDEATVPPTFMKSRRDASHLPAILLGKRIYMWTIERDLRAYDHGRDYLSGSKKFDTDDILPEDEEEDMAEKKRQRAFRTDTPMWKDHAFWMNAIEQERAHRSLQAQRKGPKRRRSIPEPEDPSPRKKLAGDSHPRMKRLDRLGGDLTDKGYGDDALFIQSGPENNSRSALRRNEQDEEQEDIQANHRQAIENMQGNCTVNVASGSGPTSFQIPNSAFSQCLILEALRQPVVLQHQTNHQSFDTFIKLSEHFAIEPKAFKVIVTYLHKGSFSPQMTTNRRGRTVIEGVVEEVDADNAAQRFAQAYHTASLLQLSPLQQQCVEKLRVLPSVSPLALMYATTYFNGAQQYGCVAETKMEEWLVERISGSFWRLVKENGEQFGRIMEDLLHLRMRVFDRMAVIRRGMEEDRGAEGSDSESEHY